MKAVTKVYVSRDSAAASVGADEVVIGLYSAASRIGREITVVRNGTRGMLWLEPLVEIETPRGRVGFGPVRTEDIDDLVELGMLDGLPHELNHGVVEDLPWMREQQRLCLARVGVTDPLSSADYVAHGGLAGLRRAFELTPAEVIAEVTESGLRGRGGAGFPAGVKWQTVADADGPLKFVCCNADEGDSGTFADRVVMEGDPFSLLEGMTIAAYAVGASEGYLYLRSEYPDAASVLEQAIEIARTEGWLGENILGSGLDFDIHLRIGRRTDTCGSQAACRNNPSSTARAEHPINGASDKPRTVDDVLSLTRVRAVPADHGKALTAHETPDAQVFQLAGNVAHGGVFETVGDISLRDLVYKYGAGTRSGRPVRMVQVGGPRGACIPADTLDRPADTDGPDTTAMLAHGGVVIFDDTVETPHRIPVPFPAEPAIPSSYI